MPTPLLPGFDSLQDVINSRLVDDEIIRVVDTAITTALAVHNQHTQSMLDLFCTPTTEFKLRYETIPDAYLQPHDGEFARAQSIKGGAFYDVAFPMGSGTIGFGWTRKKRIKSTVADVNKKLYTILGADKRYLRYNIMAALFQSADFTYEDQEHGSLVVKPLANGDTQEYQLLPGAEIATTANHYLAQAAAITDAANPFPTIYNTLNIRPENGDGDVIAFIPTGMKSAVEALASFIAVPNPYVIEGANTRVLAGSISSPLPGNVLGMVGKVWVCEWRFLPDNYIMAIHTGADKPLAMRQDETPELQGFRAVGERSDLPYTERQYERHVGFGVMNRLGALIYRVGNASYAIPSGFDRVSVM